MNEDIRNDLLNARVEMRMIMILTAKAMNTGDERLDKDLHVIRAYAENELIRLDRFEVDINELT